ncbi:hypothetical protein KIV56_05755 [Cryobacterium breve]|uniref:Flavodoxin-like domain-containing protein n=1 Tax=Cryobacterium breve TaxID=1259258 RepID=A0ABY7NH67_9MICO|nr:hypothetical protein KIV56_05755 [Cryobacterium breve]
MVVLVGYSSKYGATEGIAERIARKLREAGRDAEAKPVSAVENPDRYTAFVIGRLRVHGLVAERCRRLRSRQPRACSPPARSGCSAAARSVPRPGTPKGAN